MSCVMDIDGVYDIEGYIMDGYVME